MATLSPRNLCDVLVRLRDPRDGVRLSRKVGGGTFASGESFVNYLMNDIGERAIVTKPEVVQLCQALVDRNLLVDDNGEPGRFSEQKNYSFNDDVIKAFERGAKGATPARPPPSRGKPPARRPVPTTARAPPPTAPHPRGAPQRQLSRDSSNAQPPSRGKLVPPPARRRAPLSRSATDEPTNPVPVPSEPPEKPSTPPGPNRQLPPPRSSSSKNIIPPKPRGASPQPPSTAPRPQSIPVNNPPPKPIASPSTPPRGAPSRTGQRPAAPSRNQPPPAAVIGSAPPPKPRAEPPPRPRSESPSKPSIPHDAPPTKPRAEPPSKFFRPTVPTPVAKSGFEKAQPSEKARSGAPSLQQTSKISPQRAIPSPERRRPPPVSTEPSRLATRPLGASKAVLESAKAEPSTVKGQLISAEKNFLIMCSSGLDAYANTNQQLTEYDKECLFANLDSIINTHTNALSNLNDDSTASDLLFNIVPHLHLYLSYIANMSKAFVTLSSLRERGVFLDVTQKDTLHAQTIEALLERPKQYLEDYPALISTLMERVDPSCEEHRRLGQALQAFESIQRQVEKRDLLPNHLTLLWDIEQSFEQQENLQLGDQELYKEGTATLVETNDPKRSNGERIRVLIFRGLVIVAVSANQYSWKSIIKNSPENLVVHDVDKWDNCLEFVHQSQKYTLNFHSPRTKWMNYLPVQYPNGRKPLAFKMEF